VLASLLSLVSAGYPERRSSGLRSAGEMMLLDTAEASLTDAEHRALVMKTWNLIETTRREILQLQQEIRCARDTIDQSQKLLSRTSPASGPT